MCSGFLMRGVVESVLQCENLVGREISPAQLTMFFSVVVLSARSGGVRRIEVFQNEGCVIRNLCHAIPAAVVECE